MSRLIGVLVCKVVKVGVDKSPRMLLWANGKLPWHARNELQHFWDTVGNNSTVLMGSTTLFEDWGSPKRGKEWWDKRVKPRINVVMSTRKLSDKAAFTTDELSVINHFGEERTWVENSGSLERIVTLSGTTGKLDVQEDEKPRQGDLIWLNSPKDTLSSLEFQESFLGISTKSKTDNKLFLIGGDKAMVTMQNMLSDVILSVVKPHVKLSDDMNPFIIETDKSGISTMNLDAVPGGVTILSPGLIEDWNNTSNWNKEVIKEKEDFEVLHYSRK